MYVSVSLVPWPFCFWQGSKLRHMCAELALKDALDSLASTEKGIYIAVFGA